SVATHRTWTFGSGVARPTARSRRLARRATFDSCESGSSSPPSRAIPMKIAPRIHRLGDRSIVNSYLVEDSGEVTIIDAGVPGFYRDIAGELAAMGRTVADVRALVLTHGHTDHIGFAERLRRDERVPVSVDEMDA